MNSDEHFLGGMVAGGILEWGNQSKINSNEINFGKVFGASILGGFGGLIPDLLEPANNPNHREFFHSLVFGYLLLVGNQKIQSQEDIKPELKFLSNSISNGIFSHLGLDSTTSRSLPLI